MSAIRSMVRSRLVPRPPALSLFVPRAAFLWILVRFMLLAFTLSAVRAGVPGSRDQSVGSALRLLAIEPPTALLVAATVAGLMLADIRALRERVFLANLGIGPSTPVAIGVVVSIGLESTVALIPGFFA